MGHTNIKTTQIYAKITKEKISQDMEALSHKLKGLEMQIIERMWIKQEFTFAKNNKYIKMIRLQNINLTSPEAIQRLANNHAIAVNLRDGFPYPYTIEDAITVCYVNFQN